MTFHVRAPALVQSALALIAFLSAASIASAAPAAQSERPGNACTYEDRTAYRLHNLPSDSYAQQVFTGPSRTRRVINELPLSANAIRCVGPCKSGWCRIRWHGIVGWVPRRHLKAAGRIRRTTEPYP